VCVCTLLALCYILIGIVCGKPQEYCLYLDACSLDFARCRTASGGVWDIWTGTTLLLCSVGVWMTDSLAGLCRCADDRQQPRQARRSHGIPASLRACVSARRPLLAMASALVAVVVMSYYLASLSVLHPGLGAAKSATVVGALASGAAAVACSWWGAKVSLAGKRSANGGQVKQYSQSLPLDGDFYAGPAAASPGAAAVGRRTAAAPVGCKSAALGSVLYLLTTSLLWLASLGPRTFVGLFFFGAPEASTNAHLCSFAPYAPQGRNVTWPGQLVPTWRTSYRPQCFDRNKCSSSASGFKVYVYPRQDAVTSALMDSTLSSGSCPDKQRLEVLLSTWRISKFATQDPSEACILVPNLPVDGMCKHGLFQFRLTAALRDLPTWNQGQNHILAAQFDDDDCPQMEADYAAHLRSTFSTKCYRAAYDHTMQLVHQIPRHMDPEGQGPVLPFAQRRLLSSFVGRCSTDSEHTRHALHSAFATDRASDSVVRCIDIVSESSGAPQDFSDVLQHSKFAFAPRGHGFHSFRLLEAMQYGAVPVVIGDTGVLPFDGCVDWRQLSMRIRQADIPHASAILRRVGDEEGSRLQKHVREFISAVAQTWRHMAAFTLECVRRKIYGPAVWEESEVTDGTRMAWLI